MSQTVCAVDPSAAMPNGARLPGAVLLTGASGFLGAAVLDRLRQIVPRVITIGRLAGDQDHVVGDLTSSDVCALVTARGPFDAIVDFAAALPDPDTDPLDLMGANLKMAAHVATVARLTGAKHVVYASTCAIFGRNADGADEDRLPAPMNVYAVSKLAAEHLLRVNLDDGVPLTLLRISAPYGPGLKRSTVVTTFLSRAAAGDPLTLMGSGRRSQDFVYQDDVARAVVSALAHRYDGPVNIAAGRSCSMRELAEAACAIVGRNPKGAIQASGTDPQEGVRARYSIELAGRVIAWQPEVSLADGLERTATAMGLV